jgi:AraC-like DNA-binding protein
MELVVQNITYKGRVVFQKVRVSSFSRLPKEHFENEACFVFVKQGEFYVRAQTEKILVNQDTALLAKCLHYFYESTEKAREEQQATEVVGVLFYPDLVQDLFELDLKKSQHSVDYNLKQVPVNQLLAHYRESINILLDNPELADEQLIRNKLREFVLLMTKTIKAPSELDFLASMFQPNFAKFEEVIQHNLYASLDLNEFAALCHMSLSTFKRKFKEVYKESPAKYFTKMKMKKAAEMLVQQDLRVSDIAYDLGYDSLTTFNRAFKEQMGKSPSEFRMNQNG